MEARQQELTSLRKFLVEEGAPFVFPEVICTDKNRDAVVTALQADGIGDFKANTVITDYSPGDRSLESGFRESIFHSFMKTHRSPVADKPTNWLIGYFVVVI